jgi:class 3 adenylate cyclase/tetratricopeptide (TPR) repeat protein
MECPRCRHDNPASVKFCGECGARLDAACPACGAGNPPSNKFCHECGTTLAAAPAAKFAAPGAYTPRHLAERILTSRASLDGERKQVTVLFADVKGSMELLADRDPEEARAILDPVLERMMEAVHRYEGTVNQVMGDGIMALFGAPLAHEDHAVRACYAALRMQESVKRYAEDVFRAQGVAVEVRIGINSGEVVVRSVGSDLRMDYSAVGQTTHLAARMEQLARPGSILLTGQTLKLAEGYVQVNARGPAPVKGLSEPVEVFEATGAGPARRRFDTSAIRGLTRFVGRSNELKQMRNALEQAAQAHGQVVALVGQPGVGKTRLFHEFTHSHRTAGWLILESGSVSYGKATPYLPLIDLLKAYFRIEPADSLRSVREKATGKLLALDRALEPALPAICALLDVPLEDAHWNALDPAQRRSRMLDACKRLILREAQVQPLLVVFEDLHWVDAETQAFLDSLMDSVPSARLLLLVNYRPEYVHRWGNRTYYLQLRVDPLGAESATELLDALLGGDAALAALKRLLVAKTEGVPFFLEECVRTLVETGALAGERGAYRLTQAVDALQVPATVQAILASRVDRLLPEDKRLLQLAAVIGHDVPMRLLEALAEEGEQALREGLARLQAAEFLYEASLFPELEYSFKHALTHEVTYGGLLQERRRQLHARVMDAIERVHAGRTAEHVEALARHALRAEIWDKAADYLREAGALAQARGALADVLQRYEQALEAVGHLPQTGDNLRRAIDARLDLSAALPTLGQIGRAIDLLGEAEPLARELNDAARQSRIAVQMGGLLWFDGRYREGLAQAQRARAIAEGLDDAGLRLRALYCTALNHAMMGAFRPAIEHMAPLTEGTGAEIAKRLPSAFSASSYLGASGWRAVWHALLGEFDAAIEYGDRAVQAAEASGVPRARAYAYQYRGNVSMIRGDLTAALPLYQQVLELSEKEGMTFWVSNADLFLGRTLAELGRAEEGLEHSLRGIALQEQMGTGVNQANLRCHHAATLMLAGRIAEARTEAEHALEVARADGERGGEAFALLTLGRILFAYGSGDLDAAAANVQQALAITGELGMRPLLAHCHLGLGQIRAQAGERAEAQDRLATAAKLFRELGMAIPLKQAEAELESIR